MITVFPDPQGLTIHTRDLPSWNSNREPAINISLLPLPPVYAGAISPLAATYEFNDNRQNQFYYDLLSNGKKQKIVISKLNATDSSLSLSILDNTGQNSIFNFNVKGGHTSRGLWFITHVRGLKEPELIYFSTCGPDAILNDFKIFAKNDDQSFRVLFNLDNVPKGEFSKLGSGCNFNITPVKTKQVSTISLYGKAGKVEICWDNEKFIYKIVK